MNRRTVNTWGQTLGLAAVVMTVIILMGTFNVVTMALALLVAAVVFFVLRAALDLTGRDRSDRPPAYRDVKVIALGAQIFAVAALHTFLAYLWQNFKDRTDDIGLNLSFDFLDQPGGITIADNPLSANDQVNEAIRAGFENTIRIIILGIPLALVVGTLVGIARLSSNWLLQKIATLYVEAFRNIPVLVVILIAWSVYLNALPPANEGSRKPLGGWFIFNNSRFSFPSIKGLDNWEAYRGLMLVALLIAIGVWIWRTYVFNETGTPHRRTLWSIGTFVGIGAVLFVAFGGPFEVSKPFVDESGRIYTDGLRMQMPFAAIFTGLVVYTATHISEIVRGSILAVHKGQDEAANALALSGIQRYRFVILPQALRIAFPPLINQFLNFTKNSSLAIAIGFAEVTAVINNLFGQSQPAPQLILILMLSYLVLSLILSVIGNLINRRLQLVGR
ncbi:MAG: ABC transporter permease subunit [Acidimicrobiales bacterium]|nr:ABC transporter permease subunit [Acidimicrobiales bacterium]